ncbi:MAG: sigma-70 family RNA polymerase sigma factor [Terriglobales bacterium]|jgi:RNA polymerase sigma-70 factor (ECF subfamily)
MSASGSVEKPAPKADVKAIGQNAGPKDLTNEDALIRRVQNGERDLFYELVQPYERRLYAAAFSILRNPHDAEDAAQEAILKALKNIRQFRFEARFSTWLIQITINEARMRRRKEHAEIMEPIGEYREDEGTYTPRDFADWREIPSESLERTEVRELLLEALASLGAKYREIFILRDVNHLSIEEVSGMLGISRASVKTRLLRARLMLRDLLAPKMSSGWFSSPSLPKGEKPW